MGVGCWVKNKFFKLKIVLLTFSPNSLNIE